MLPAPLEESASTARALKARRGLAIGILGVLLAAGVASCGGSRQDANEPEGNFPVSIISADFPSKQQLAQTTNLTLAVENTGDKTIPNLAITIFTTSNASTGESTTTTGTATSPGSEGGAPTGDLPSAQGSFSIRSQQEGLAIPFRPVWILNEGYPKYEGEAASAGAEAAQTDTYAFGEMPPNTTKRMVWNVTPVQGGTYTGDGSVPEGEFVVRISTAPPQTRVDGSGKVVPINPSDIVGQAGNQQQKSELNGQ
jgi:hypothetical protein